MKYFVLDINDESNGIVENCLDALRLATLPGEAEIICFTRDEFMNRPSDEEFFEQAIDRLRDADILLSFTDRNIFIWYGRDPTFRKLFYEKIDSRTPFFFQFMNVWEMYYGPGWGCSEYRRHYTDLLEYLEAFPTGIRIYNPDDSEYFTHYTPEFEPVPINPNISSVFEVGRNVGIFEANLMTFGEGNSALLRSHDRNIHDGTRDPGAGLPDFEKHSPFVIRNTEKHFGFFISGTLMAVRYYHRAQHSAVPEANIAAISNIVRELQSNVRMTTDA